jgi:hypothetical protein
MRSILGRTWKINEASPSSPFQAGDEVVITTKAEVIARGRLWQGEYDEARDAVTVQPKESERWELVGSGMVGEQFTLVGLRWEGTKPDALGTWVADPQGTP